jgi:hypothetical protein
MQLITDGPSGPQGRGVVARALRELKKFGYYRVDKVRRDDGTFVSEAHVYDTPQLGPNPTRPDSGESNSGDPGANPVNNRGKVPTLPGQRSRRAEGRTEAREDRPATGTGGRDETPKAMPRPGDEANVHSEAVATLFRVIRPEPRLRLGTIEALALAPLVAKWLERGYGQRELAEALLSGLPDRVQSAPGILRDRLTRKLPPPREPYAPVKPTECDSCGRPTPHKGICRVCAGLGDRDRRPDDSAHRAQVTTRGRARIRAALLAHRLGQPAPSKP